MYTECNFERVSPNLNPIHCGQSSPACDNTIAHRMHQRGDRYACVMYKNKLGSHNTIHFESHCLNLIASEIINDLLTNISNKQKQ